MRVGGQAAAGVGHLLPEAVHLVLGEPALDERPRVDARREHAEAFPVQLVAERQPTARGEAVRDHELPVVGPGIRGRRIERVAIGGRIYGGVKQRAPAGMIFAGEHRVRRR